MDKFLDAIITFFKALFSQYKIEPIDVVEQPMGTISHIPKYGEENSEAVRSMQKALKVKGYVINVDGDYGPKTKAVVSKFQKDNGLAGSGIPAGRTIALLNLKVVKPEDEPQEPSKKSNTPWFWALKKYEGKVESDPAFNKEISSYWSKVGLPGFKSIVGSKRAWCGLFIAVGLIQAGLHYQKDGAGAKNWDKYGQTINWKVNGFPQGAIIRINSGANCSSGSGNHVTMANGDCTAQDLLKAGATVSAYGGNQSNQAKVSTYSVSKICSVKWPGDSPLPGKVTKSLNCSNGKTADNESTR